MTWIFVLLPSSFFCLLIHVTGRVGRSGTARLGDTQEGRGIRRRPHRRRGSTTTPTKKLSEFKLDPIYKSDIIIFILFLCLCKSGVIIAYTICYSLLLLGPSLVSRPAPPRSFPPPLKLHFPTHLPSGHVGFPNSTYSPCIIVELGGAQVRERIVPHPYRLSRASNGCTVTFGAQRGARLFLLQYIILREYIYRYIFFFVTVLLLESWILTAWGRRS